MTVVIWWTVLVPLIHHLLRKESPHFRQSFWTFNKVTPPRTRTLTITLTLTHTKSPVLVNIHLLNLPFCAAEFLLSGSPLGYFDLWAGLVVAFLYLLWYLLVLDANGAHFYIVLSPRPHFSAAVYFLVLGLYVGLFRGYSWLLLTVPEPA